MRLSNDVFIIGTGESKYGELWERSLREISVEAGLKAIESSGVRTKDLDAIYMGNSLSGMISGQENIGALMSDYAGIADEDVPTLRIEASTASGAAAVYEAYLSIKSGEYDFLLELCINRIVKPCYICKHLPNGRCRSSFHVLDLICNSYIKSI